MEYVTVTLKLQKEDHAWLKTAANNNVRSLAGQIAYMIRQWRDKEHADARLKNGG
jgi:hypothetical protein